MIIAWNNRFRQFPRWLTYDEALALGRAWSSQGTGAPAPPVQLFFNWIAAGGGAPVWWPLREHPLRRLTQPWAPRPKDEEDEDDVPQHPARVPVFPLGPAVTRAVIARFQASRRQLRLPLEGDPYPVSRRDAMARILEADDELLLLVL